MRQKYTQSSFCAKLFVVQVEIEYSSQAEAYCERRTTRYRLPYYASGLISFLMLIITCHFICSAEQV